MGGYGEIMADTKERPLTDITPTKPSITEQEKDLSFLPIKPRLMYTNSSPLMLNDSTPTIGEAFRYGPSRATDEPSKFHS
jgi:hypothetical protein